MRKVLSSSCGALCARFVAAFPVQHASIVTLGDPFEVETICASDAVAAALEETQLDLGVGPSWRAWETRAPVLIPDLSLQVDAGWPMLLAAAAGRGVRSMYAFPMVVGPIELGAVDLYATRTDALSANDIASAATMAGTAALQVLESALRALGDDAETNTSSRRFVHQATGMVIGQLRVTPENALLIIRAHAFATGRSVLEVSEAILMREIDFSM